MKAFLVNCNLVVPDVSLNLNLQDQVRTIEKKYNNHNLVSLEKCHTNSIDEHFLKDKDIKIRYDINQSLICSHREISKNMYHLK